MKTSVLTEISILCQSGAKSIILPGEKRSAYERFWQPDFWYFGYIEGLKYRKNSPEFMVLKKRDTLENAILQSIKTSTKLRENLS